ncbi:Fuc2NAc and GlcNAc transferase [Pseudomonas sp. NFR16]|nr:Fuc2NAc and GlcNAc transferase [Pseudomonas sp. NFR16]
MFGFCPRMESLVHGCVIVKVLWLSALVVFLFSVILTWLLRMYALRNSVIDIPNERSSHSVPTPRGGGVAIVISFMAVLPYLWYSELLQFSDMCGLLGAGGALAILGFLDDHGHIAARWRLAGHFIASGWILFWLGGLPAIEMFGTRFDLGWIGTVLGAFYIVWLLNLYNFMDGIDGLASVQTITTCVGACVLYYWLGENRLIPTSLLLAISAGGFLCWNFPPARIFMGDAGSGFLGIVLAALSLQASQSNPDFLWAWLILLGVFIVDATFTLMRRLLRGERVYEAHRTHAYQYASRRHKAHLPVTLTVLLINVLWLFPWAAAVVLFKLDGPIALLVAYAPLVALAIRYNAGTPEHV